MSDLVSDLVVFDTCVLLDAMQDREQSRLALDQAWSKGLKLAFSQPTMDELGFQVADLDKKFGNVGAFARFQFLSSVERRDHSHRVQPAVNFEGCEDAEDNKIVSVAMTVGTPLVTWDKELLQLNNRLVEAGGVETRLCVIKPTRYSSGKYQSPSMAFVRFGKAPRLEARLKNTSGGHGHFLRDRARMVRR